MIVIVNSNVYTVTRLWGGCWTLLWATSKIAAVWHTSLLAL